MLSDVYFKAIIKKYRKKVINISKIELDKYYTSSELAQYIANKTKEIIGEDNITEYLEPSAGSGVFLDYLDKPYLAYDIEPEDNRVVKQDYLTLNLSYKQGRCIIGNPPYGEKNNLSIAFYNKSILLGDYIAFILPISQLNNNIKLYKFDLIHNEDLGEKIYTNRKIHCCFNVYKRPLNNKLNEKPNYKLKDIEIKEARKNQNPKRNKIITKDNFNYDIRIMAWGGGKQLGKEVNYEGQYAKEFCIKINNNIYKEQILNLIKNAKWREIYLMTNASNLLQWQVYKYIKEQIPEIK